LKLEILKHKPDFEFWDENLETDNILDIQKEPSPERTAKKGSYARQLLSSVDSGKRVKTVSSRLAKKFNPVRESVHHRSLDEGYVDDREVERLNDQYKLEKRNHEILKRVNNDLAFQKGKFEEVFDDCIKKSVEKSTEREINQSHTTVRLPYMSQSVDGLRSMEGDSQMDTNIMVDQLKLAEMKLTAQDKKVMIEEFLANSIVKDFLYKKFTEEPTKKPLPKYF